MTRAGASARAALHEKVRAFIDQAACSCPAAGSFDALGLEIARYQAEHIGPYRRLLAARRCDVGSAAALGDLPAVPTDAFRLARIAAHADEDDEVVFVTSGTTGAYTGTHAMSTTGTYEKAALAWGRWALFPDAPLAVTAILLADPAAPGSSLGFMLRLFAERFAEESRLVVQQAGRDGALRIDADGARRAVAAAHERGGPAIVMGTSFAFVRLIDGLAAERLDLPRASRIMHTGGLKGRSREIAPADLVEALARVFGVDERAVVGEYGMTELSSQLYEGTLRGMIGKPTPADRRGVFVPPPWMRVVAADAETLAAVPPGEAGILRIEDLANVDSAVAIQTADLGRIVKGGVELIGRAPGADLRGCSLAMDDLLSEPGA
jgi:acyl-CoA synthetase (AMP-forming)/AMP-acid ligase II